jgi:hypothetical protein
MFVLIAGFGALNDNEWSDLLIEQPEWLSELSHREITRRKEHKDPKGRRNDRHTLKRLTLTFLVSF